MNKLNQLTIDSFRGVKNLNLENFSDINVFVGENNTGKTSILEAIQLIVNPFSKIEFIRLGRQREKNLFPVRTLDQEDSLRWLFARDGKNNHSPIKMSYSLNAEMETVICKLSEESFYQLSSDELNEDRVQERFDEGQVELAIEQMVEVEKYQGNHLVRSEKLIFLETSTRFGLRERVEKGLFPCKYISSTDHRTSPISTRLLSELTKEGKKNQLIDLLKKFDENILGIENIVNKSRRTIPYIDHKEMGMVPIGVFGDGLRKALLVASHVIQTAGGILLIDELETGIHTKLIPHYLTWISELCLIYDVRLFATTHSLEAVDGILEANMNQLNRISFYRLTKKAGLTGVKYFSGAKLKEIRYEFGQDVR